VLSTEVLALAGAAMIAVGSLLMKQGLQSSTRTTLVFVTVGVQAAIFVTLTAVTGAAIDFGRYTSVLPFVVTGILGSVLARFLITTSVDVVGLARAMPVRTTSPVFSAVIAIGFFGEHLSLAIALGTVFVVGGLAMLTYDAYDDRSRPTPGGTTGLVYLVPVFVGSVLLGVTPSLRKFGLDAGTSVYGGLALNFSTAFLVFGTYYLVRHRSEFRPGVGVLRFVGTGACWSLGFWLYFTALQGAETVIVVPLFTTTPLFVIVLSWLFLDDIETVSKGLVVGAVAAVVGAALVVVG
jgi:drug/metabolite transporter (DMT)-like permease